MADDFACHRVFAVDILAGNSTDVVGYIGISEFLRKTSNLADTAIETDHSRQSPC